MIISNDLCMKDDFKYNVLIEFIIRYGCIISSAGVRYYINRW